MEQLFLRYGKEGSLLGYHHVSVRDVGVACLRCIRSSHAFMFSGVGAPANVEYWLVCDIDWCFYCTALEAGAF